MRIFKVLLPYYSGKRKLCPIIFSHISKHLPVFLSILISVCFILAQAPTQANNFSPKQKTSEQVKKEPVHTKKVTYSGKPADRIAVGMKIEEVHKALFVRPEDVEINLDGGKTEMRGQ